MNETKKSIRNKFLISVFSIRRLANIIPEHMATERHSLILPVLQEMNDRVETATALFKQMNTTYTKEELANQDTDVHTEHCCKNCGCKYGEDTTDYRDDEPYISCSVVSGRMKQSYPCGENCRH